MLLLMLVEVGPVLLLLLSQQQRAPLYAWIYAKRWQGKWRCRAPLRKPSAAFVAAFAAAVAAAVPSAAAAAPLTVRRDRTRCSTKKQGFRDSLSPFCSSKGRTEKFKGFILVYSMNGIKYEYHQTI